MRSVAALALLALTACGGTPTYYLTPPPGAATRAERAIGSLAVADISLPAYAEAIEIAVRGPSGALALEKSELWADTPRRALTRHLVAALQARLTGQIATEPWPSFDGPVWRLEVVVDRMIGAPEGPFEVSGQFVLVSVASGRIASSERFAITVPAGPGYQGLIDAHARAVEALADQIAARLTRSGAA